MRSRDASSNTDGTAYFTDDYPACPRCGQCRVETQRAKKTGDVFQLCNECDAVWPEGVEPNLAQFGTFDTYMAVRGLPEIGEVETVNAVPR